MSDLGNPATDRPLTLRVGPRDDPNDPGAMRVIKSDETDGEGWHRITGPLVGEWMSDEEVAHWPYTSHALASAAFRTPPDPWEFQRMADTGPDTSYPAEHHDLMGQD